MILRQRNPVSNFHDGGQQPDDANGESSRVFGMGSGSFWTSVNRGANRFVSKGETIALRGEQKRQVTSVDRAPEPEVIVVDLRGPNCRGMSRGSATKCITSGMFPVSSCVYSLFQPTTPREGPSVSDKLTYRCHCSSSFVRSFVVLSSGEKHGCDFRTMRFIGRWISRLASIFFSSRYDRLAFR